MIYNYINFLKERIKQQTLYVSKLGCEVKKPDHTRQLEVYDSAYLTLQNLNRLLSEEMKKTKP